jgi:hypothetical protein
MPAASDPTLPVTFRPRGVRVAAGVFGVLLVATVAAIWIAFPDSVQEQFTLGQKVTVLGMGLLVFAVGHALVRCRVDADEQGLTIVNGYRTHELSWPQVVRVTLRPGSPWVVLDLTDGTTRSAMGIQGSDGARAVRQTRQLRALVESHAASEPQD